MKTVAAVSSFETASTCEKVMSRLFTGASFCGKRVPPQPQAAGQEEGGRGGDDQADADRDRDRAEGGEGLRRVLLHAHRDDAKTNAARERDQAALHRHEDAADRCADGTLGGCSNGDRRGLEKLLPRRRLDVVDELLVRAEAVEQF